MSLVSAKVPMIMTAHILLPKIDAELPASLSRKILSGILRDAKFDGVILADDLGMGAITKLRSAGRFRRVNVSGWQRHGAALSRLGAWSELYSSAFRRLAAGENLTTMNGS